MKPSFLSFASRFVMAILIGLGLLMLHSSINAGALSVFVPQNTSPWELGKVAFWPLLMVAIVLPAPMHQSLARCMVATVSLVLLGWLMESVGCGSVVTLVLWIVVVAVVLALLKPETANPWWAISVFVLLIAYMVLTFYPAYWGPFLDPSDVKAMATLVF